MKRVDFRRAKLRWSEFREHGLEAVMKIIAASAAGGAGD
jgi:hypothetical protein